MSNEHTAPAAVGDWVRHMTGEVRRIRSVKPDGFFITDRGRNAFGETWAWSDCVKTDAPESVTHQSNDMYSTGRADACGVSRMTEHLPECWSTYPSDPTAWCICDELLACEKRVLGEGIQKLLIAEGVRGFIEYGKSRWNKGYEMGYEVAKAKYKKGKK